MMETFAVKCPCPEVFDMLLAMGIKAGYENRHCGEEYYKKWFCCDCLKCSGNGASYDVVTGADIAGYPIISIEAAIAELQKPREKPITIGGKTLSFPGDGSIKLSCGDVISAEVADEIQRRRLPEFRYFQATLNFHRIRPGSDELFEDDHWTPAPQIWDAERYRALGFAELTEAEARERFPEAFA